MRFSINNTTLDSSYNVYVNGNDVKSIDANDTTVWEKGRKLTFSLVDSYYSFPAKKTLSAPMNSNCKCAMLCFDQGVCACFIPYRNSKCCYRPMGCATGGSQYYGVYVSCIQMNISSESAVVCIVPNPGIDECASFTVSLAATNTCTGKSCSAISGDVTVSVKECAATCCQTVLANGNSHYKVCVATKRTAMASTSCLGDFVKADSAYWTVCGCVTSNSIYLNDYLHQNTYYVYVNGNLCCAGIKYKDFDGLEINIV